jgi:transcriptional regulator with XRE-family HTH domain
MKRLRQRMRLLRELRGFTQQNFAEKADVGYKYYQSLESGGNENPTIETLEKIAAALRVT